MHFLYAVLISCFALSAQASPLEKRTQRAFVLKTNGAWAEVTKLVNQGIIPNARSSRGWTLLHYSNDTELTKALIAQGADVNIQGAGIDPKLAPMRQFYRFWKPEDFLAKTMQDIVTKGKNFAPLHTVRNAEVAQILLTAGASPDIQDSYGRTPLHHANSLEMVQTLIQANADVNLVSKYGTSPLANAMDDFNDLGRAYGMEHYAPIIKLLIASGANPNTQDGAGHTALHVYNTTNPPEIVQYLLQHKADPFLKTTSGDNPLCYAIAGNAQKTALVYLSIYPLLIFEKCSQDRDMLQYAKAKASKSTQDFVAKSASIIQKELKKHLSKMPKTKP